MVHSRTYGNHTDAGRADLDRYDITKQMYLKVLPQQKPGLTEAEILERLLTLLPKKLFPNGVINEWWAKTIRLDLEVKGSIAREPTIPLRLHKV